MGLSKIIKSGFYGYLLLGNPQTMAQQFSFTNPQVDDDNKGFCDDGNLSIHFPSDFKSREDFLTERKIDAIDTSFAFEPNVAKQESWGGRVANLASTIYDYTCQLICPRKTFRVAIEQGNLDRVRALINAGAEVNYINIDDETPLLLAIEKGNWEIALGLINAGAEVNYVRPPLQRCKQPLLLAIEIGNWEIAQGLINAGANVHYESPSYGIALFIAVKQGNWKIALELINAGADVNYESIFYGTALSIAVKQGNLDIVRELIENGANVNLFPNSYPEGDHYRVPPIYHAMEKKNKVIFYLLYQVGASLEFLKTEFRTGEVVERIEVVKNFITSLLDFELRESDAKILNDAMILKEEAILKKLLSHAFEFGDSSSFPYAPGGGAYDKLESFPVEQQATLFDCIYDITKAFFKEFPVDRKKIDTESIVWALNEQVSANPKANKSFIDIDKIKNSKETVIIHGGYFGHAIDITFSGDYLILCNKGSRPDGANQVEAYKINRNAPNSEEIISELSTLEKFTVIPSHDREKALDCLYTRLPKAFQGEKDWICDALSSLITTNQTVENCVWESAETGLEALIGLDYLLKHQDLQDKDGSKVRESLDRDVHELMERWRKFAKMFVLDKYEEFYRENLEIEMNEELLKKAKAALKTLN